MNTEAIVLQSLGTRWYLCPGYRVPTGLFFPAFFFALKLILRYLLMACSSDELRHSSGELRQFCAEVLQLWPGAPICLYGLVGSSYTLWGVFGTVFEKHTNPTVARRSWVPPHSTISKSHNCFSIHSSALTSVPTSFDPSSSTTSVKKSTTRSHIQGLATGAFLSVRRWQQRYCCGHIPVGRERNQKRTLLLCFGTFVGWVWWAKPQTLYYKVAFGKTPSQPGETAIPNSPS